MDHYLTKADLNSGVVIEVWLYGAWRTARAEFDHRIKEYVLYLFDDLDNFQVGTMLIAPDTRMRRPQD